jgi:serine protein kinase
MSRIIEKMRTKNANRVEEDLTLQEYLDRCKSDPTVYATVHERLLEAIGEANIVDTSKDARLGRIFSNRTIKVYPAFKDFFGMEETVESLVHFLNAAKKGLEEKKQILYLLGPVGGGKSSLAETIKKLIEKQPIYVLQFKGEISPVFESPLGLFSEDEGADLEEEYGIPKRLINGILSPWAVKRLDSVGGDMSQFNVKKIYPSKARQIAVAKVEPSDENNQDISSLVGKVDIRQLEKFKQNDPDAYGFSGGLNRANQGVLEFVEMFKAPIKMLHPLLTATQEENYNGTEPIGSIPYQGMILAHSNEAEWETFKNNKNNEAFIDRICVIKVPYCLRVTEEQEIYKKLISRSDLAKAPCVPGTLEMLARLAVMSRLNETMTDGSATLFSKMRVYDGETLKDVDPNAKPLHEYKSVSGVNEGMSGSISTRFAYKILSKTFMRDPTEVAADPVHLIVVLEEAIKKEQFPEKEEKKLLSWIKSILAGKYFEFLEREIQEAYLESYHEYGQNIFDRYVAYADAWLEETDYKDTETGQMFNKELLDTKLKEIEGPSNISNTKDFRNEIVKFCLRAQKNNNGENPDWKGYQKIKTVIQKKIFSHSDELLPVISFGQKKDTETSKKHTDFLDRMKARGYSEKQTRRLVEWYMRSKNS